MNFLDFISRVLIIITTFLLGAWAFVIFGSFTFSLECSEATTTFCDYQTFAAGIFAILAALITSWIIWHQIHQSNQSHFRELRISSLLVRQGWEYNKYEIAKIAAHDICAIIKSIKNNDYENHFNDQASEAQKAKNAKKVYYVTGFCSKNDYFVIYKSFSERLGNINSCLIERIIFWYTEAMELDDTIRGIHEGDFQGRPDQEKLAKEVVDNIKNLCSTGNNLIKDLKKYADEVKEKLSRSHDDIDDLISIRLDS